MRQRQHEPVDAVALQAEGERRLRKARQRRLPRRLVDDIAKDDVELPERLRRHRFQQRIAIGKVPIRRRLGDSEFLCKRADVDGFRPAALGFLERGLHQGIAEIPVVVGVDGFADQSRRH